MTIAYRVISRQKILEFSVPARPIYEGAAPCPHWLAPCPIYTRHAQIQKIKINLKKLILKKKLIYFLFLQNVLAVFVFSDSRRKNACKMLADLCPCFHQSPTRPQDQILVVHA